ncbi:polyadenylate-binding protein-interacting protein 1-like [Plakobranchus ocellatus]|uniref:Polyadenylate-binding protein-interacting protein 1-like n=1 Tax=Plakobranchus ocellatus TaxID=259542 RepID=A0AAV4BIW8_9GAST|nr:polyadenylate-binding protein-interacting protein 1-like [Plakobranchus ocellatus]
MASNENNQSSHQQWRNTSMPGPAGDNKNPRPPKIETESRVLNIIKNNEQGKVTKSLSANAKEFVPQTQSTLSASAQEFVPKNGPYYGNDVSQSIQDPNFRYTGARICQYLSTNLKNTHQFTDFHKMFMERCRKEFDNCNNLLTDSEFTQERLRGLTMFMAELFLNVQVRSPDDTWQRIHFLPDKMMDLVLCLLSKPDDLNIKCVCQLLKLSSGAILDNISAYNVKDKFEKVFTTLQSVKGDSDISK